MTNDIKIELILTSEDGHTITLETSKSSIDTGANSDIDILGEIYQGGINCIKIMQNA